MRLGIQLGQAAARFNDAPGAKGRQRNQGDINFDLGADGATRRRGKRAEHTKEWERLIVRRYVEAKKKLPTFGEVILFALDYGRHQPTGLIRVERDSNKKPVWIFLLDEDEQGEFSEMRRLSRKAADKIHDRACKRLKESES
jgi:hypothetical protein